MGGQPGRDEAPQLGDVQTGVQVPFGAGPAVAAGGGRDDVGDELRGSVRGSAGPGDDGRPVHSRVVGQRVLYLLRLDPEAADLHLVIGAAGELQFTVGVPARQVAGPVHAPPGFPERAGHEALGGQGSTVVVAPGESGARDVEVAEDAGRQRSQLAVEDVERGVPDRGADRYRPRPGPVLPGGDVHGCLGRPVQVVQQHAEGPVEPRGQLGRQRLSAAHDPAQTGARGGRLLGDELGQHRRDEVRRRDAGPPDHFGEVVRVAVPVRTGDHQGGAGDQRPEELPDGHVERGGRLLQDPVGAVEPETVLHPEQPVDDRRVRDDGALGPSGRSRRVDHVRGVVDPVRGGPDGLFGERGVVGHDHGDVRPGQPVRGVLDRQQQRGPGVGEHKLDPRGRVVRVDGDVGGARPEHRDQGDDQFQGAGHGDRDEPFGPGAALGQLAGQPTGALGQFPVGQPGVLEGHRDGVRGDAGLAVQQFGQGRRRWGHRGSGVLGEQRAAFGGVQRGDGPDGGVRVGKGPAQERHEPLGEPGDVLVVVLRAWRVEADVQVAVGPSVGVDADHHLVDHAEGATGEVGCGARQVECFDGGEHVDDGAERAARVAGVAGGPFDQGYVVPGVPQDTAPLPAERLGQFHEVGCGVHPRAQRHPVGEQAEGAAQCADAVIDGDGQQRLGQTAHVPQERGGGRGDQVGHRGARRGGGVFPGGEFDGRDRRGAGGHPLRCGEAVPVAGTAGGGVGARTDTGGQTGGGQVFGEVVAPEPLGVGEPLRLPVRGVLRRGVPQRVRGALRQRGADAQRAVDLCDPPGQQGENAERVGEDVVEDEHEQVAAGAQPDRADPQQRVLGQVEGLADEIGDDGAGRVGGVGGVADIEAERLPRPEVPGDRPQPVVVAAEVHLQRVGFRHRRPQGRGEQGGVQVTVDVPESRHVVRYVRSEFLREPHGFLRGCDAGTTHPDAPRKRWFSGQRPRRADLVAAHALEQLA